MERYPDGNQCFVERIGPHSRVTPSLPSETRRWREVCPYEVDNAPLGHVALTYQADNAPQNLTSVFCDCPLPPVTMLRGGPGRPFFFDHHIGDNLPQHCSWGEGGESEVKYCDMRIAFSHFGSQISSLKLSVAT